MNMREAVTGRQNESFNNSVGGVTAPAQRDLGGGEPANRGRALGGVQAGGHSDRREPQPGAAQQGEVRVQRAGVCKQRVDRVPTCTRGSELENSIAESEATCRKLKAG